MCVLWTSCSRMNLVALDQGLISRQRTKAKKGAGLLQPLLGISNVPALHAGTWAIGNFDTAVLQFAHTVVGWNAWL